MAKRFASKKGIPCFSSNIKRAQTKGLAWCQYDSVRGITPLRNKRPATHCLFKPDANSRFFSALPFLLYNGNNYAPLTALPLLPHQQQQLPFPPTSIFDSISFWSWYEYLETSIEFKESFDRIRNSKFRNNFSSALKMGTCQIKCNVRMSSQPV